MGGDGHRKRGGQHRIHLDRGHLAGGREQGQGQRAEPRPDLEHDVLRFECGQRHDAPDRARVGDEVLAQPLGRPDVQLPGQVPDLPRGQRRRGGARRRRVLAEPALPGGSGGSPPRVSTAYHGPKTRWPVAAMIAHSSATSSSLIAASARSVCTTWTGELDLPRFGTGVRNGASVSTSSDSGGATAAASRSGWAFLNVSVPAKLSTSPAATQRLAIA